MYVYPLSVLREGLGEEDPPQNLVEYVNGFRRRLFFAGLSAQKNLAVAQEKMKNHSDSMLKVVSLHQVIRC